MPAHIRNFIFFVLFAALALVAIFFIKWQQGEQIIPLKPPTFPQIIAPDVKTAEMKLVSSSTSMKVGENFKVSIMFQNKTAAVGSFDAVVSYDPDVLRADEIVPSTVFPLYPRKLIEDFNKRVIVTGVITDLNTNLPVASGELATVSFTALKSGRTKLDLLVEGDKYTNVMNKKPENILKSATGVDIDITE